MATTKKRLAAIKNLKQLQHYKRYLRKKIYIRERLLNKHLKDFYQDVSAEKITQEVFAHLKLRGPFWQFLPKLFSSGSFKKYLIPLFSGLGAMITSSFLYREKTQKNSTDTPQTSPPYSEEDMFI